MDEPKKIKIPLGVLIGIVIGIILIVVVGIVAVKVINNKKMDQNAQMELSQTQGKNEITKKPVNVASENLLDSNSNTLATNTQIKEDAIFLMTIEDVTTYTSGDYEVRLLGTVEKGTIKPNDTIQIINTKNEVKTATVGDLQLFRKHLESATKGDSVDIMLKDVKKEEVEKGGIVVKLKQNLPDTIPNRTEFEADIHTLKKEEGGRYTPFYSNYQPQIYFGTSEFTGKIQLDQGVEKVSPGEDAHVSITLNSATTLEVGTKFTIREGKTIVANGTVTKVKNP